MPAVPAAIPEWAREHTTFLTREHPERLPSWLEHVAEVEDAKRYQAAHPPVVPDPPADPREFLHLLAVQAHRALASGRPAPAHDPGELCLLISDALQTEGGNLSDEVYDTWYRLAREHGVTITDAEVEFLRPLEVAVNDLIAAAIWFGITTGHYALTGECSIPRRFLPYFGGGAGSWGAW